MPISGGGQAGSGLDRALQLALEADLDVTLETGELYPGERTRYPDPDGTWNPGARPWQKPMREERDPPGSDESLRDAIGTIWKRVTNPAAARAAEARQTSAKKEVSAPAQESVRSPATVGWGREPVQERSRLRRFLGRLLGLWFGSRGEEPPTAKPGTRSPDAAPSDAAPDAAKSEEPSQQEKDARSHFSELLVREGGATDKQRFRAKFRFRDELTGVVMVHGIGPQLAGQTLLDWARPIITLIGDAAAGDRNLEPLTADERRPPGVSDPVFKSNIDFSGETFPVVQVRIPRHVNAPADDPRASERRWIFTETWWASEVRPPTLRAMIGWLGEEGGVGRILQGIQENLLGRGLVARVAKVSLQAFVSVIVSFVLLVFLVLLGLTRLIPFGPLQNAITLRLAASFITDWFGGARTLLRDPAQSANVRGRLVATIKALRAYGCRHVVIVAHSGGTMVSLMTLTDPAYPRLQVEKLITIGEALNLGWRLENANPDESPPVLREGNRMAGDLATNQKHLKWRDFWATHDPAPSGRPTLPQGIYDPGAERFTAERVYNRMSTSQDHGGYWDNDEQFLIPLIREIDVATGDRSASRFYSDEIESKVRARRKERVALLALWRRAMLALPIVAIVAAALLTNAEFVRRAGDVALAVFHSIPGNEFIRGGAKNLAVMVGTSDQLQLLYDAGIVVFGMIFMVLLALALLPARVDRLWLGRPLSRIILIATDLAIGLIAFLGILAARFVFRVGGSDAGDRAAFEVFRNSGLALVLLIVVFALLGRIGRDARATIAGLEGKRSKLSRIRRDGLIVASAIFLGVFLVVLIGVIVAVVIALVGNFGVVETKDTRRFILGVVVILIGFRLLGRLGTWRWDSWDIRERRALRRRPTVYPFRYWSYGLSGLLTIAAVTAAVIIAFGLEWALPFWAAGAVLIVLLSVGKDVVDNDIDTGDRGGGTAGAGEGGPVMPGTPSGPPPGPAAA